LARTVARVRSIDQRLRGEIEKGLRTRTACAPEECRQRGRRRDARPARRHPAVRDVLATDIEAAYDGDPAAQSFEEIVLAYPGLQATAVHRLAHVLWRPTFRWCAS